MKRALVIGSQVGGLAGVHNDIAAIQSRLESREFKLDVRTGDSASRAGILAGLERLITDSSEGDAAVIYYSGHGGRVVNPRWRAGTHREPELLHCLVPTDWDNASFRGLLDIELSHQLAELTSKTRNVAVILDCCHSARMWKALDDEQTDDRPVVRAIDRIQIAGVAEHLEWLEKRERYGEFGLLEVHAEGNPDAVRLVAAEADQSAYELPIEFGGKRQRMGIMTAMLSELLDKLGTARISWRTLAMLVRERVMKRYDFQRPEIEGPGQRYLFELASAQLDGGVVYFEDRGRPALRTCRLLGTEVGARYALMRAGCSEYDPKATVAEVVIAEFVGAAAHVRLELRDEAQKPSIGTLGFLLEAPLAKRGVRLLGEGSNTKPLREAIAASKYVTVADRDGAVAFLTVDVGDELKLIGDDGHALAHPERNDAGGRDQIVRDLERWARAEALRTLADGDLGLSWKVEWGRVVDGQKVTMAKRDTIYAGDGLYIEFHNPSERPLLFTAFDIGVDGAITLLTNAEPTGTRVESGRSYALGLERSGAELQVGWPEHVPSTAPLPGAFVIIVSETRHDFRVLETQARAPSTALEHVLAQIGHAGSRNVGVQRRAEPAKYAVARVDFMTSASGRVSIGDDR